METQVYGSTKIAEMLSQIATARGLDLTLVGATATVLNGDYEKLVITVKGTNLVEAGHFGEDTMTGQPKADPAVLYYTGRPGVGWVPLRSRHDYKELTINAGKAHNGTIVSTRPREMQGLVRYSDAWAARLRSQGYIDAALEATNAAAQ